MVRARLIYAEGAEKASAEILLALLVGAEHLAKPLLQAPAR